MYVMCHVYKQYCIINKQKLMLKLTEVDLCIIYSLFWLCSVALLTHSFTTLVPVLRLTLYWALNV